MLQIMCPACYSVNPVKLKNKKYLCSAPDCKRTFTIAEGSIAWIRNAKRRISGGDAAPVNEQRVEPQLRFEACDGGVRLVGCSAEVEGRLEIPGKYEDAPVVSIGEKAFAGCGKITAVTVPESVEEVCSRAFEGCMSMTEIRLGPGVKVVGEFAFLNCVRLGRVRDAARPWVHPTAFSGCYALPPEIDDAFTAEEVRA